MEPEEREVGEPEIPGAPEGFEELEADAPAVDAPGVGALAVGVDAILETEEALGAAGADGPEVIEKPVATGVGMAKDKPSVPPTE